MADPLKDSNPGDAQKEIRRRLLRQEQLARIEREERRRLAAAGWRPPRGGPTVPAGSSVHDAADVIEAMEQEKKALAAASRGRAEARAGAGTGPSDSDAARLADRSAVQRHSADSGWLEKKLNDVQTEMEDMIGNARYYDLNYTADMMRGSGSV